MAKKATAETFGATFVAPLERFRAMRPTDETSFRALLRAVYDHTYSHKELYLPGGYSRFVQSNRAILSGEFDESGAVVGHVAFLRKDPKGDYVEQGMALRHPHKKSGAERKDQEAAYRAAMAQVAAECFFIHQNVTTQHPLAQRFAARMFGARATGFIVDFAVHQSLKAYGLEDVPMSALVMSVPVRRPLPQSILLPDTPWGRYIALIYGRLGLPREIRWQSAQVSKDETGQAMTATLECFEANPNLGLMRRVLKAVSEPETGPLGAVVGPRVDLVHVPLDGRINVAAAFQRMLGEGYLPVAVRPHARRADEVVFQALDPERPKQALAAAKIADECDKSMLCAWLEAHARA